MAESVRQYVGIDAKSFYASVECAERHLNPLTTHLVVADASRTEKTICLAVSPSLKAHGIPGRPRLFEVVEKVRTINRERLNRAKRSGALQRDTENGGFHFSSASFDSEALEADPTLELSYIVAPPRMRLYEEYSSRIYQTYLKYIAPEDILVYSIDEVFIDLTGYLKTYGMTAHELTMTMVREVLYNTGITATAGIGTNLYLAKVAMDIVAKKSLPDKDGVRIAELNERSYRELLWAHRPLTDFWRIGGGIASRLERMMIHTMGDLARASLDPVREEQLYHVFGINAELLIDHAWGWEPTPMEVIKQYRPATASLSSGQVLHKPYTFEQCRLIVKEMTELLALDLVRKQAVTKQLVLDIAYDRESLNGEAGRQYRGAVGIDYYGRRVPRHAHGTGNLDHYTSSARSLTEAVLKIYDRVVDRLLLVRRVNIAACGLIPEAEIPVETHMQMNFLADFIETEQKKKALRSTEAQEHRVQKAVLEIQDRFGKNALLKGMNLLPDGTTLQRNRQIGGHSAGDET